MTDLYPDPDWGLGLADQREGQQEPYVRVNKAIRDGLRKCRHADAPSRLIHEADILHVAHMVTVEMLPLLAEAESAR